MNFTLTDYQFDVLEELLFNKYQELETEQNHYIYCLNKAKEEFTADYYRKQLNEIDACLIDIKSLLLMLPSLILNEESKKPI